MLFDYLYEGDELLLMLDFNEYELNVFCLKNVRSEEFQKYLQYFKYQKNNNSEFFKYLQKEGKYLLKVFKRGKSYAMNVENYHKGLLSTMVCFVLIDLRNDVVWIFCGTNC